MILTIAHTLSSFIPSLFPRWPMPLDVLLTNVVYDSESDGEMVKLLEKKVSEYPVGTTFIQNPHTLSDSIFNGLSEDSESKCLVVDNINLFVSNLMLRMNSCPDHYDFIYSNIHKELQEIGDQLAHLPYAHLILLTAEVDYDFFSSTSLSKVYQRLMFEVNRWLYGISDAYYIGMSGGYFPLKS